MTLSERLKYLELIKCYDGATDREIIWPKVYVLEFENGELQTRHKTVVWARSVEEALNSIVNKHMDDTLVGVKFYYKSPVVILECPRRVVEMGS